MRQRNISREMIELCLNSPEETYSDKKGKMVYARRTGVKLIRVIVKNKSSNDCLVITVKD
jgi:hypothetical protein